MKYPISMRIMHWIMALIIIGLVISGLTHDTWPKDLKPSFYYWHKSFGVVALLLIIARIFIRIKSRNKIPPLPETISKKDEKMSHAGHHTLYLLMVILPVSGYLMSMAGGYGVKAFGYALPNWFFDDKNKEIGNITHEIHQYGGIIIAIIVTIHILAVIKHAIFEKENLVKRMV